MVEDLTVIQLSHNLIFEHSNVVFIFQELAQLWITSFNLKFSSDLPLHKFTGIQNLQIVLKID